MPRPRVRFTVRRMMVVVLVAALALAIGVTLWRGLEYERISCMHQEAIPLDYLAN
jgi:hypothetical protein